MTVIKGLMIQCPLCEGQHWYELKTQSATVLGRIVGEPEAAEVGSVAVERYVTCPKTREEFLARFEIAQARRSGGESQEVMARVDK